MIRIILVFILFTSQIFHSQNLIRTDIVGKKLEDFIKFENEIGSKIYKSDETYVSFKPVLEPIYLKGKKRIFLTF